VKQTSLFDSRSDSELRRLQRWLELAEPTQQELVTLLVQLVIATDESSDTEERGDGRDD